MEIKQTIKEKTGKGKMRKALLRSGDGIKRIMAGVTICLLAYCTGAMAQTCATGTITYTLNFVGHPDTTFTTPSITRNGSCCGGGNCVHFILTLDTSTTALNFQITSGAKPSGSLYYQVDCGTEQTVGNYICIAGTGTHDLTFCKPGNNANTFSVYAIAKPTFPTDSARIGCSRNLTVFGLDTTTVTWNSITGGTPGTYNSYLSCTTGCTNPLFTPAANSPSLIEYLVCGSVTASQCAPNPTFCDTVKVYVFPKLNVSASPNPATLCPSSSVTLSSNVSGGYGSYSYTWKNSGNTVVGSSSSYSASATGTYQLLVNDEVPGGCAVSVFDTVKANVPVTISAGGATTFCQGGSVSLNASAANNYSWSPGGATTSSISATAGGTYTVTATSGVGCTSSATASVTVNSNPTISIVAGGPVAFCQGGSVMLSGSGGVSYVWSTGSSAASISVNTAGSYSVTGTNGAGCSATSTGTTVTVNANPVVSLNSISLCEGASGSLCAASSGSSLSYLWSNGLQDECFTVTVPNTYSVVVTDGNSCHGTASEVVSLVQAPTLVVTASGATTFCTGDSVTLTASGAISYSWNNGSTSNSIKVKNDGLYSVTGSNGIGCAISFLDYVTVYPSPVVTITPQSNTTFCQGGSVELVAGGAATYIWSNSTTGLIVNASTAGTYAVVGTDGNGCISSATLTVNVNALPNVTLSSFSPVCVNGGPMDLNQGSPVGGTYSGQGVSSNAFNPVTAGGVGSYLITYSYTNGNGCSNSTTAPISVVDVTPNPGPISGPAAGVCANTVKSYSITPVVGATSYIWTAPNNASVTNGQGTNSVSVTFGSSFGSGTLSVAAYSGCGSSPLASMVHISSVPAPPAAIFGNGNPCKKGINLYWVNPVTGATSYTWNVPAGSSILKGQGTDTIEVNTGKKSGNIMVMAANTCGNSGTSASLVVDVSCRTADPADAITDNNELNMTVYPNPAHDQLNIKFTSSTENNYYLRMFDLTGRLVMDQVKKAEVGENLIELNLNFAKGLYIVSLSSGDLNKQAKIIVQ